MAALTKLHYKISTLLCEVPSTFLVIFLKTYLSSNYHYHFFVQVIRNKCELWYQINSILETHNQNCRRELLINTCRNHIVNSEFTWWVYIPNVQQLVNFVYTPTQFIQNWQYDIDMNSLHIWNFYIYSKNLALKLTSVSLFKNIKRQERRYINLYVCLPGLNSFTSDSLAKTILFKKN